PSLGSAQPVTSASILGCQLFRDVLAVKTVSCGVTFSLPQLGHLLFAFARGYGYYPGYRRPHHDDVDCMTRNWSKWESARPNNFRASAPRQYAFRKVQLDGGVSWYVVGKLPR